MTTAPPAPRLSSPYKGLAAFDDTDLDALFFFGRERDTEMISANLMASRFTVLYGASGVGKSSVLRAGAARRLRSTGGEAAVIVHDSWAEESAGALLLAAAQEVGVEPPEPGGSFADGLAEITSGFPGYLYLVFDQFEELFVYPGAEGFAASVAEALKAPRLRVNVLLSLREDALSELDVFTGRIPNVFGNYLALDRLDRAAGRAAILGPLERYNELSERSVGIEEELVDVVLNEVAIGRVLLEGTPRGGVADAAENGIEAPYLQLVMERLWEEALANGSNVLRREMLDDLGGAGAVVRAHLDDAMDALSPLQRDMAANVFNHLVTPSGTKIAHGVGDLAGYAGVGEAELGPVVASLGSERILRRIDGRCEIFHDVLAEAVLAWRTRHQADRLLEQERAEAARRHRRLLVLLVSAAVALAAMAAVAIYALTQGSHAREQAGIARVEARSAEANALSAQASVLIPVIPAQTDPELGLLLAAEAARRSPTHRAADTLRRALLVSHLQAVFPEKGAKTAAFSPDGTRVVVGTAGGAVRIYAADARTQLASFRTDGPVTGASLSPDGSFVLTTERGGPARLWDAETGDAVRSFGAAATSASFGSDGSLVLTVEPHGARIWRASDGAPVSRLRQPDEVTQASFGPDDRLVATAGGGDRAQVFEARTGRLVARVDQGGEVTSATIAPDGRHLVTTGANGTARFWAIEQGGRLLRELRGHGSGLTSAAVSPDGRLLVTTSADTTARVWALPSGALRADLIGHSNRVDGAAFSPDGSSFVTWSVDGTARVWDRGRGAARVVLAGHGDAVTSAAFDPSGERVLTTSANGRARIWRSHVDADFATVARVHGPVSVADFSGDGSTAAVADRQGIELLGAGGERVGLLPAPSVDALALNRDGSFVAAASGRGISVWRLPAAEPVATAEVPQRATALAFDAEGDRLAIGTAGGTVRVLARGGDGSTDLAGTGGRVSSVAFSPTADRIAAGFADGALEVWSLESGRSLYRRVEHQRGSAVTSVAFSGSGARLVTAGEDATARVWDAATARVLYTLRGHSAGINDAVFSPDGQWIATAARSLAGLWDRATEQRLIFLRGQEGRMVAVSFDPAGRQISTVGADGTFRSYACEVCGGIDQLLRVAERRLAATGRTLTPAERRLYMEPAS